MSFYSLSCTVMFENRKFVLKKKTQCAKIKQYVANQWEYIYIKIVE